MPVVLLCALQRDFGTSLFDIATYLRCAPVSRLVVEYWDEVTTNISEDCGGMHYTIVVTL